MSEVTAEWRKFTEQVVIPSMTLESVDDEIIGGHIYRLAYRAATRKHHVMEYDHDCVPVTWWDHLKQTLQDRGWLPQRVRVNVRSIPTLTHVYHVCPHMDKSDSASHIRWIVED